MIKALIPASLLLLLTGSSCNHGLRPDEAMAAVKAGDYTALIKVDGCGYQPLVTEGYTYCRVAAGPIGLMAVTFIAPPEAKDCDDPISCVRFKLLYPTGEPAYGDQIPKGQSNKKIPWGTLTKTAAFTEDQRGFWPYVYEILWKDSNGMSRRTVSEGEIRLRVYKPEDCDTTGNCLTYAPLREVSADRNFVWSWIEDGQAVKMTTGARTYVSPKAPVAGTTLKVPK